MHLAGEPEHDEPLPIFSNAKKLLTNALKKIFKTKQPEVNEDLWKHTYQTLNKAISKGTGTVDYNKPDYLFTKQLRDSAALFAAKKSWAQATELAAIASSKPGYQITWKEFLEKARPIIGDYNQRWLKTEFNTAIRAARQAKLWKSYEDTADIYPNLRYMPSRAATPREEHKPYYGVVRPLNDDFWVHHLPPSAWNCICGVEQTDDDVNVVPIGPDPAPGLNNNPGLTGKLFSDQHPYSEAIPDAQKMTIAKSAEQFKREHDYALLNADAGFQQSKKDIEGKLKDFPRATHEELAAINHYTKSDYWDINKQRRGEAPPTPFHSALGDVLIDALEKLPNWKGTSYRATNLPESVIDKYRQAMLKGSEVEHAYFTSSSADSSAAGFTGNVYFVINSLRGKHIDMLSNYAGIENEVLYTAGSTFKVDEIQQLEGKVLIRLSEHD